MFYALGNVIFRLLRFLSEPSTATTWLASHLFHFMTAMGCMVQVGMYALHISLVLEAFAQAQHNFKATSITFLLHSNSSFAVIISCFDYHML